MRSHTLLSDHYNSLQLFICQSSVFEDLQTFITHSSKLHSFLWMWTRRPHFWARMRDVGDLPVLTFGSCVLKTGMIKWTPKLYVRFYFFFQNPEKHDFLHFWVVAHVLSNTAGVTWRSQMTTSTKPCLHYSLQLWHQLTFDRDCLHVYGSWP